MVEKLSQGPAHHVLHLGLFSHVGRNDASSGAQSLDLLCRFVELTSTPGCQGKPRTFPSVGQGDGPANASACTSDQCYPV